MRVCKRPSFFGTCLVSVYGTNLSPNMWTAHTVALLGLLGLQYRSGNKPVNFQVVCPQSGTAVLTERVLATEVEVVLSGGTTGVGRRVSGSVPLW